MRMRPCEQYHFFDPYTNSCVPGTFFQFEPQLIDPVIKVLHGIVFPLLSVLVLIMNGAVIAVLRQQNRKSPTVGPLEWLAVSSCLIAASPLPFIIYYYHLGDPNERIEHIALCHLEKICMQMLPFFFNSLTTFFTLLLGIQRFIAVLYPLECSRWCSIRVVHRWARFILIFALFPTALFYLADTRTIIHHCWLIPTPNPQKTASYECTAHCYVAHTELAMRIGPDRFAMILDLLKLCLNIIPSSILFVITILLIRTIRIADSSRLRKISGRHRRGPRASTHTTMMLAVVISLFLLARLPITLLLLLRKLSYFIPSLDGQLDFSDHPYLIVLINNLMIMTVHPITFGVYMLMSRRFRTSLRHLFGCRFLASDADLQAFSSVRMQSIGREGGGGKAMDSRFLQKHHRVLTSKISNNTEQTSFSRASTLFDTVK